MRIDSKLTKEEYLSALRGKLSGLFSSGQACITGIVLGSWFSVTFNGAYEYPNRYSHTRNHALGFVRKGENGCTVHYWKSFGIFSPFRFLLFFAVCMLTFWFGFNRSGDSQLWQAYLWVWVLLSIAICLCIGGVGSLIAWSSQKSEDEEQILQKVLRDPTIPSDQYLK